MASAALAIVFGILFLVAYFSKRRFGILALGLCAGALLSQYFTSSAAALIESQGVQLIAPPLGTVVGVGLTMLPVLFLLTSGPEYAQKKSRVFGGLLFSVLGILFMVPVLRATVANDAIVEKFFMLVTNYGGVVTAALIIWAVLDTMFATSKKSGGHHASHH